MRNRRPSTILLITADRLVRADIRSGGSASSCQVYQQPRPAVDDLPSLVEAAIHLGPQKVRRVLLLCSDFWTQTLPLASRTASSMSEAELAQALAFEVEPFSGISAFDSLGSYVSLPAEGDQQHFWFTQVMASVREQVEYVVGYAGGKLVGVAHPAGLPRSLGTDSPQRQDWQRVEIWPEAVVSLHHDVSGPLQMHIVNSSPQPGLWERDVEGWFGQFGPPGEREVLLASERVPSNDMAGTLGDALLDLSDERFLKQWLSAWAKQLSARSPGVPIVRPASKPMANSTRYLIAGLIGAVALFLCLAHYWWANTETRQVEQQLTSVNRPAEQLKKDKKQTGELRKQLAELKGHAAIMRGDLDGYRGAQAAQRQRMAQLLRALAETAPDRFVIQAIDSDRDGIRIRGICLRPEHANGLALVMDEKLRPLGLHVHLPEKEAQYLLPDGEPYMFELLIQDVAGLKEFSDRHDVAGSPNHTEGVNTPPKHSETANQPQA